MNRLTIAVLLLSTAALHAQREFGFDNRKSSGQPYLTPEETVKRMKVAPEFEVKLFAGEPDCVNPIAMTIDERGRVWIVECFEYPSRTPKGKAPRDRIVILEDTDGDGRCDKRTIFCEGKDFPVPEERKKAELGAFDLASGIEVGNGGVYLGAPPYLWFIENKDDKPGKFERLLSGFGSQDTHETLNTFQWGPDGWLYGLHGVFTHSNVKSLDGEETRMNAAVWRFHPKTRKFEIYAEGTSNPWGMDYRNTDGQWILACCVIPHLYHIVPGGIYKRQGGQSFNPYAYGQINEICDHTFHKESGWAHAGLISLDFPHMPEKYRNSVIFGSIHGCSLKQNILKPNGSSFIAIKGEDFLVSGDKNFRPINMRWGPHGDIYLIDWHDQNPCHQAKPDSWDYERGRVYRIEVKGRKGGKAENLASKTPVELLDFVLGDRPYESRTAARVLSGTAVSEQQVIDILSPKIPKNGPLPLKVLWAGLAAMPVKKEKVAELNIPPGAARELPESLASTIRVYAESPDVTKQTISAFTTVARETPHPAVRRELASAAVRHASQQDVVELLHALMDQTSDQNDPQIPHLIWIAYEKSIANPKTAAKELPWLAEQSPKNILVRDTIVPRVMRRLIAANEITLALSFLALVNDAASLEKALDGLVVGLDQRTMSAPESWPKLRTDLLARNDPKLTRLVNRIAVSFRDPAAIERALKIANDTKAELPARLEAIRQVATLKADKGEDLLMRLLETERHEPIHIEAARSLSAFDSVKTPGFVLARWKEFSPTVRGELVNTLASRKHWSKAMLQGLVDKKLDAKDLTDNTIVRIQAFKDKELDTLIAKAWGRTRPTPDELLKLIDQTRDALDDTPASYVRGQAVFKEQCAKCHKFNGEGVEVGPPLDGAARDIEYILANVIDPNRVIGAPYFLRTAKTLDGQVFQGVLLEEDDQTITLKIENAVQKKIAKADLDGPVTVTEKSMMPEGLTAGMTPQNFRDVIRYVMAHPFITDVTVNGKPVTAGVRGRIALPESKQDFIIESTITVNESFKTKLLLGSHVPFTVKINGVAVGQGTGSGTRANPDTDVFDVVLPKGDVKITIMLNAKAQGLFVRFLDPDRRIQWK